MVRYSSYNGGWKVNVHDGYGTHEYADGGKYVGGWRDGKYSGHGVRVWSDGRRYDGGWEDGLESGRGSLSVIKPIDFYRGETSFLYI